MLYLMVFCGQCGSQIAPGMTRCPNCGTVSDIPVEVTTQVDDAALHVDDPTIESPLYGSAIQSGYPMHTIPPTYPTSQNRRFTPPEQHKLILRADSVYDYDAQGASEATSEIRPSMYSTYSSSPRPVNVADMSPSLSSPSSPYNTIAEQTNYPNAPYIPTQVAPNYQTNPTPVNVNGNYPVYPQQYLQTQTAQPMQPVQPVPQQRRRRRHVPVLLTILLLLVLMLGGLVFYALRHTLVTGNTNTGTTQTTTTAMTPIDHAKALVEQYYNDINNKNYNEAYYLWQRNANGQSYASFVQGYAHTVHDDLTINNITESGSAVKVAMTIVATENNGNRTRQHTYAGYYMVGQVGGAWKILRGYLVQVR